MKKKRLERKCPSCDTALVRRPACYHWRGATMHGWVCVPCNSLWDLNDAFIKYVKKRLRQETFMGLELE